MGCFETFFGRGERFILIAPLQSVESSNLHYDRMDRIMPCACGSRSFWLDMDLNWQCERCVPPVGEAARFERTSLGRRAGLSPIALQNPVDPSDLHYERMDSIMPCACGCRSYWLDTELTWQCERCAPPPPLYRNSGTSPLPSQPFCSSSLLAS